MAHPNPIHIFRPGRHTAMSGATLTFSEADLQASADAYDPALHEAPIVVGHPTADAPAYGWVAALSYGEAGLQAHPHQLDEAFSEMVRKGRFKKVSASFYTPDSPANPKPGVYYVRHVGFLGAQPPAVKGLKQAEFADDAQGVIEVEFAEDDDAALWARFKAWLRGQLAAEEAQAFAELSMRDWSTVSASDYKDAAAYCDACLVDENASGDAKVKSKCHLPVKEPGGAVNRHALMAAQGALVGARGGVDLPANVKRAAARKLVRLMHEHKITPAASLSKVAAFSESAGSRDDPAPTTEESRTVDEEALKAREAELAKRQKEIDDRQAAFAEREQRIAEAEAKARKAEVREFVEGLVTEGKILPRDKPGLIEFMAHIDAESVVEFGEGDEKVSKPATSWLKDFLKQLPKAVEFAERGADRERDSAAAPDAEHPPGWRADPAKVQLRNQALAYAEKHKTSFVQAVQAIERGAA